MINIILKALWETVKAVFFRIGWRIVFERFLTRGIVWALRKLATMTTNDVGHDTAEDIIASLQGKRLPEAKPAPSKVAGND